MVFFVVFLGVFFLPPFFFTRPTITPILTTAAAIHGMNEIGSPVFGMRLERAFLLSSDTPCSAALVVDVVPFPVPSPFWSPEPSPF